MHECPIHRALCDGCDRNNPTNLSAFAFAVPTPSRESESSNPESVISTEAAHSFIVRSAVEKSAALPRPSPSHDAFRRRPSLQSTTL
jgi:hypothetical protein